MALKFFMDTLVTLKAEKVILISSYLSKELFQCNSNLHQSHWCPIYEQQCNQKEEDWIKTSYSLLWYRSKEVYYRFNKIYFSIFESLWFYPLRLFKIDYRNLTIIQGIHMNLHCFGLLQLSSILLIVSSISNSIEYFCPVLCHRAEILFGSYFGRNDDFINSFQNLLTFN